MKIAVQIKKIKRNRRLAPMIFLKLATSQMEVNQKAYFDQMKQKYKYEFVAIVEYIFYLK